MKTKSIILITAILLIAAVGCAPTITSTRIEADTQTDLSGYWNDTDSRLVAETMVTELVDARWLSNFKENNDNARPRIIIGAVRLKDSMEHIKTEAFTNDIQRELINSGMIDFVASSEERQAIRDEKVDQSFFASGETAKELGNEQAADFMLQGNITMHLDMVDNIRVKFYKVDLELLDIETNVKVWVGTKEIKKVVTQKKVGW